MKQGSQKVPIQVSCNIRRPLELAKQGSVSHRTIYAYVYELH